MKVGSAMLVDEQISLLSSSSFWQQGINRSIGLPFDRETAGMSRLRKDACNRHPYHEYSRHVCRGSEFNLKGMEKKPRGEKMAKAKARKKKKKCR